jgi:hypothetical protein
MPAGVLVIWWITLIVAVAVVLPLAWYLLHRVLLAARNIERYAAEALGAGAGIARNTAAITALLSSRRWDRSEGVRQRIRRSVSPATTSPVIALMSGEPAKSCPPRASPQRRA